MARGIHVALSTFNFRDFLSHTCVESAISENFSYSIQHIANIKRTNSIRAASSTNMTVNRFGRVSAKDAILRIDRWLRCRSARAAEAEHYVCRTNSSGGTGTTGGG